MKNFTNTTINTMDTIKATILGAAVQIGTKKFINVPVEMLKIDPDYQREIGSKVNRIVSEFDPNKMRPGLVSYRDNDFWLIDGQNRCAALKQMNKPTMVCEFVEGLTKGEEAALFVAQNDNVTKLNPAEKINGRSLNPDDKFAITIKDICNKYNLTYGKRGKVPYRNLASISRLENLYAIGKTDALYYFVETIEKAGYLNKPYAFSSYMTKMFMNIWKNFKDTKTEEVILLLKSFKEVEFLISKARETYYNIGPEKALSTYAIDFINSL